MGSYHGRQLENYQLAFDVLANKPTDYADFLPWYSNDIKYIFDSIEYIYGPLEINDLYFIDDEDAFTRESFIEYIDQAFEAWDYPWSKGHVSFNVFCNFVLPHRISIEALKPWRQIYSHKFNWIDDSVSEKASYFEVGRHLNKITEFKGGGGLSKYPVPLPPTILLNTKFGSCMDATNHKSLLLRSFGIPVVVDFVPIWGNDHNSHYWNAIPDENGNFVSFAEILEDYNSTNMYNYIVAKVYRKTFTANPVIEKLHTVTKGDIPSFFSTTKLLDVTKQYVLTRDVKAKIANKPDSVKYIYLAVFNNAGWTTIDFSCDIANDIVTFTNVGCGAVYLPHYFQNGEIIAASAPVKISKRGTIYFLNPDMNTKTTLSLTRKYYRHWRKDNWLKSVRGGVFEGANSADFADAVELARVNRTPGEHYLELFSNTSNEFKYLRFRFSEEELKLNYDNDGASIAEIEFISDEGEVLEGTPLGTPGIKYNQYTAELAFDGDPLTFFEDARPKAGGKYVGIRLKNPKSVDKIRLLARNDLNSIQPGDKYELFYWHNDQFNSLGQTVANDTILTYTNAPEGALFWLRNLSSGKEERIFTWENNKQVWW